MNRAEFTQNGLLACGVAEGPDRSTTPCHRGRHNHGNQRGNPICFCVHGHVIPDCECSWMLRRFGDSTPQRPRARWTGNASDIMHPGAYRTPSNPRQRKSAPASTRRILMTARCWCCGGSPSVVTSARLLTLGPILRNNNSG